MFALKTNNITKSYRLYYHSVDRFKEAFFFWKHKPYYKKHYAIKEASFQIDQGDTVGILGMNGSGKTTLLKLISGISTADSGDIEINGKVSALMSLGSGFHPEFTGMENIYFYASLIGMSKEVIESKLDDIISFAEIDDFIDYPIKTYSAGMRLRLAFSVAINIDPDILILDEVLAVGDAYFKQKCFERFKIFQTKKKTIIFTTHSTPIIKKYCNKAIVLKSGMIQYFGEVDQAINYYSKLIGC